MRSDAIVEAARAWVGTPLKAGRADLGRGVDDAGLVLAVGVACGLLAPGDDLGRLSPVEAGEVGDVAVIDGRLAILAEHQGRRSLIRLDGEAGARVYATKAAAAKVVEHGFTGPWPGRVASWLRYPG